MAAIFKPLFTKVKPTLGQTQLKPRLNSSVKSSKSKITDLASF